MQTRSKRGVDALDIRTVQLLIRQRKRLLLLPIQPLTTLDIRECLAVKEDSEQWMAVPSEVTAGVQALIDEFAPGHFDLLTDEPSRPPADTYPEQDTSNKVDGLVSTHTCRRASRRD